MELKIKVEKTKLITALKQNKAKHIADYKEAVTNWKKEVTEIINKANTQVNEENYDSFINRNNQVFRIDACPSSHIKEYESAIEMLEFCSDQEIELDVTQFNAFIKDEWTWRQAWQLHNSKYLSIS